MCSCKGAFWSHLRLSLTNITQIFTLWVRSVTREPYSSIKSVWPRTLSTLLKLVHNFCCIMSGRAHFLSSLLNNSWRPQDHNDCRQAFVYLFPRFIFYISVNLNSAVDIFVLKKPSALWMKSFHCLKKAYNLKQRNNYINVQKISQSDSIIFKD